MPRGIDARREQIDEGARVMDSPTEDLLRGAAAYEAQFKGPAAGIPGKHVAIVTCMDSRIDPSRIFGLDAGQVHVLRNAGGIVSDDVLRSLVLSQRPLTTREVILMHHTKCGLQGGDEGALREAIIADIGEAPPYAWRWPAFASTVSCHIAKGCAGSSTTWIAVGCAEVRS
jgi:carbonic anhydrase